MKARTEPRRKRVRDGEKTQNPSRAETKIRDSYPLRDQLMLPISLELAELEKQYLQEKVIHRRSSKQDPPETHLTSVGTVTETHGKDHQRPTLFDRDTKRYEDR